MPITCSATLLRMRTGNDVSGAVAGGSMYASCPRSSRLIRHRTLESVSVNATRQRSRITRQNSLSRPVHRNVFRLSPTALLSWINFLSQKESEPVQQDGATDNVNTARLVGVACSYRQVDLHWDSHKRSKEKAR